MRTVYAYSNCDSCRKAIKWLDENGIDYELKAIRETPPTPDELRAAIKLLSGDLRPLFNSSGADYRQLGIKERMSSLTDEDAISLLSQNGNLVKRPFLIGENRLLTGFKPDVWKRALT
ncbi:MAG: arsenate reductase family protein [Luteolibacter sp.]